MPNPLYQSVQSAIDANYEINNSFIRIGVRNEDGLLPSSFSLVRLALDTALASDDPYKSSRKVLKKFRASVEAALLAEFIGMSFFGREEAQRQLGFYGDDAKDKKPKGLSKKIYAALAAVMLKLDAQIASAEALILMGAASEQIIGNGELGGVLVVGTIVAAACAFVGLIVWNAFNAQFLATVGTTSAYQKIAIAVLDSKTTNCCKEVHGQIQNIEDPFILTGEPRFADEMQYPAFHWYCRTSIAMWKVGATLEARGLFTQDVINLINKNF